MNNDDLLTEFRGDVPLPDDPTKQRIYERATSGRRHVVTRRRLVLAVAVLAAAGIAGGLSATFGGATQPAVTIPSVRLGGGTGLNPFTADFTASGNEFTSIDLTIRSQTPETTLNVRVVRSDASQVPEADSAPNHVVLGEQVSMSAVLPGSVRGPVAEWSGTLTPSDWDGGCQQALYRIEYDFGSDDTSGSSGWFQCSGQSLPGPLPGLGAADRDCDPGADRVHQFRVAGDENLVSAEHA